MANRFLTLPTAAASWFPEPLRQLQREIDRVFEDAFEDARPAGRGAARVTVPSIDVQEADGEIRVHADLPGVSPKDLDVRVEGDVLTIRGERKTESQRNERNFHVVERSQGRFQRAVQLPFMPDPQQVQAEVREGVLEIRIPKREAPERSRRIEVRDAGEGSQALPTGTPASSVAGSTGGGDAEEVAGEGVVDGGSDGTVASSGDGTVASSGDGSTAGSRPGAADGENATSASDASAAG